MRFIDYNTVGEPQREWLDNLRAKMEELDEQKQKNIESLIAPVIDAVELHPSITIKHGKENIGFFIDDSTWATANIYLYERFSEESIEPEFSISSFRSNNFVSIEKHSAVMSAANDIFRNLEPALDQINADNKIYYEMKGNLYDQMREIRQELNYLIDIAKKKNTVDLIKELEKGIDLTPFVPEGRIQYTLYTGYGDNYEIVNNIKLVKKSGKSVLLEGTRLWSDGDVTTKEFRVKTEGLLEDLIIETRKLEEVANES